MNKWYFKTSTLVIAMLCVGPFALPFLWFNPRFSARTKVVVSAVVLVLSYFLWLLLASSIKSISDYYKQVF